MGRNSYEDCLRALGDGAYVDHLASEHSAYTGYTPLYLAVESGADGKIAQLLLDRGATGLRASSAPELGVCVRTAEQHVWA